jgi:hypothetical protein
MLSLIDMEHSTVKRFLKSSLKKLTAQPMLSRAQGTMIQVLLVVLEDMRCEGCAILAHSVTGKISDVHFGVMVCSSHTPHERAQATTPILKRTSAYGYTHDASLLNKGRTNTCTQGHPGGFEK